ncbi:gliding motility-associated lipoprotein GldB [compost metagenome]
MIWAHIIDRELLNSENPAVNAKYFGERPYVGEISGDCPGRVGQWLGWRIVELYRMKNPQVSLQELMLNEDAGAILRGSKYRGQKD